MRDPTTGLQGDRLADEFSAGDAPRRALLDLQLDGDWPRYPGLGAELHRRLREQRQPAPADGVLHQRSRAPTWVRPARRRRTRGSRSSCARRASPASSALAWSPRSPSRSVTRRRSSAIATHVPPHRVADILIKGFAFALNVGYILRYKTIVLDPLDVAAMSTTTVPATLIEVDDELTLSFGALLSHQPVCRSGRRALRRVSAPGESNPVGRMAARKDMVLDVLGGVNFYAPRGVMIKLRRRRGLPVAVERRDSFRLFLGVTGRPATARSWSPRAASDSDGDGIPDDVDKCPNEPEDKDGFQDEDGCPDPDNDGDGIPDALDQCPNEPEDKRRLPGRRRLPRSRQRRRRHPRRARQVPERARGQGRLPGRRRLPRPRQRRRRHPRRARQVPQRGRDGQRLPGRRRLPRHGPGIAGRERPPSTVDKILLRDEQGQVTGGVDGRCRQGVGAVQESPQIKLVEDQGHADDKEKQRGKDSVAGPRRRGPRRSSSSAASKRMRLQAVGYGADRPVGQGQGRERPRGAGCEESPRRVDRGGAVMPELFLTRGRCAGALP